MIKKLITLLILITILITGGCKRKYNGPKPDIPQQIKQEDYQEPIIRLYNDKNNEIELLKFEEYIEGVVAAEMNVSWPMEALKAQAIIARTYTLERIAENGGVPKRDAHASTLPSEFQAYNKDLVNVRIKQAVKETRGLVATYEGNYIKAWFHSFGGNKTANAKEGLNYKTDLPYLASVIDPAKDVAPQAYRSWTTTYTKKEVIELLNKKLGTKIKSIIEIDIIKKGPSGRATLLLIDKEKVPAQDFRLALGSLKVKSTLFSIALTGDKVIIKGTGFGHGVGLSQYGAKELADKGSSAKQIISVFYKNVNIVDVWN